jgi:hypothetical protein
MDSAKKPVKLLLPPSLSAILIEDKVQCFYPCTFEVSNFNDFSAAHVYVTGLSQLAGILWDELDNSFNYMTAK